MPYRIRIERIEEVADRKASWQSGVKPDGGNGWVMPPEGAMRTETTQIYDQTVENINVGALVVVINTPGVLAAPT